MRKYRLTTDPARYPPYHEYQYAVADTEHTQPACEGPLSTQIDHPFPLSLSLISKNFQKLFHPEPLTSDGHGPPPSFVRRTQGSLTSVAGPSSIASTARFLVLCVVWYTTSALSSNTGKAILEQFRYPVTLTIIQFGFVAGCSLLIMTPPFTFSKFHSPTAAILRATIPMGAFQVGGHMFSSMAISRIHVSTVHTIKALSPLFTVAAYALLFGVKYSAKTYMSLLPLIVGVMLASTFDTSASSSVGLLCAFGSTIIFVSSNIFFKKVVPSGSQTPPHRLDKVNLLFYSSSAAFFLMVPLWSFTDLPRLLSTFDHAAYGARSGHDHSSLHSLVYYFTINGLVHFAQNIIAFVILSSTSPVTYSIASLVKRIWVICMAILWFKQSVHPIQGVGIGMTFLGLYMYNAAKGDVEKGETKLRRVVAARNMMLPSNRMEEQFLGGVTPSVPNSWVQSVTSSTTGIESRLQCTSPPLGSTQLQSLDMHNSPMERIVTPLNLTTAFTKRIVSPTESYPSPPLSHDSPTSETASLPLHHVGFVNETLVSV